MIRVAQLPDLESIMGIEQTSFPDDAWPVEMMAAELRSPYGFYLVATDPESGHIIGYAGLRHLPGARDSDVQTIALLPGSRGRGIGRNLLYGLLFHGHGQGAREVFLEVRADNPVAQGLYLAEGFGEIDRRAGYYQPGSIDAIVMRLDLSQWFAKYSAAPDPAVLDPAAAVLDLAAEAVTATPGQEQT